VFLLVEERAPGGERYPMGGMFCEIAAPERLTVVVSFCDAAGALVSHPLNPNWPRQTLATTLFLERNHQTFVAVEWIPHEATAEQCATFSQAHDSMRQGWNGSMDRLEQHLRRRTRTP